MVRISVKLGRDQIYRSANQILIEFLSVSPKPLQKVPTWHSLQETDAEDPESTWIILECTDFLRCSLIIRSRYCVNILTSLNWIRYRNNSRFAEPVIPFRHACCVVTLLNILKKPCITKGSAVSLRIAIFGSCSRRVPPHSIDKNSSSHKKRKNELVQELLHLAPERTKISTPKAKH